VTGVDEKHMKRAVTGATVMNRTVVEKMANPREARQTRIQAKTEERQEIVKTIRKQQAEQEARHDFKDLQQMFFMKMMADMMAPQQHVPAPPPPSVSNVQVLAKLDALIEAIGRK